MADTSKQIYIDTSALIGLYIKEDPFHEISLNYWEGLTYSNNIYIITNFTFEEIMTWLSIKKGKKTAVDFGNYLFENNDVILRVPVLADDEIDAWKWFKKIKGRQSFFDCVGFAFMKRMGIRTAFTFDKHFQDAGFKIEPQV